MQPLLKIISHFQISLNVKLQYDPTISLDMYLKFMYLPLKIENRDVNRYLYINVHNNSNHNSQKLEITQMFINRRMGKQNVIYTYKGILFSHRKK